MAKREAIAVGRTRTGDITPLPVVPYTKFKIEANIPIPSAYRAGGATKWPLGSMEVGHSFGDVVGEKEVASLRTATAKFASRHTGYRFTVQQDRNTDGSPMIRQRPDGGLDKVYRCWRIPGDRPG